MTIFERYLQGQNVAQSERANEQTSVLRDEQIKNVLGDTKRKEAQLKRQERFTTARDAREAAETPEERASFESEMNFTDPDQWARISTFESAQEAEQADTYGNNAAVVSQYIGTPQEQQGMNTWASKRIEAGSNPAKIAEIMEQYNALPAGSPERTQMAQGVIESDLAQGMGAQKYLKTKEAPKPVARKIIKGADGLNYYEDTQERVLPDVIPKVSGPQVEVNVAGDAPTGLSGDMMKQYSEARARADDSETGEKKYTKLLDVIAKVDTGSFADLKLDASKALKAIGVDVNDEDIANAELFKSLAIGEVLGKVAQTKGAISEKEMALFEGASINLGNTPEGNALIAKAGIEAARRDKVVSQGIAKFIRNNRDNLNLNQFDVEDERDRLEADLAQKPIFTDSEIKTLERIGKGIDLVGDSGAGSPSPISIKNEGEYDRLPSGTVFIGPDGTTRTKP